MDNDVTCAAFDQKPVRRGERSMEASTARGVSAAADEAAKR
ncbi:hypothetical protein [Streptomyces sp. NPDC001536]